MRTTALQIDFLVNLLSKGRLSQTKLSKAARSSGNYKEFMNAFLTRCKNQGIDIIGIKEKQPSAEDKEKSLKKIGYGKLKAPTTEYREELYRRKGYGKAKAPQTEYLEELLRGKGFGKLKSPLTEYREELLRGKGYGKVKAPETEYREELLRGKGYGKVKSPRTEYREELLRRRGVAFAVAVNELVAHGVPEKIAEETVAKLVKLPPRKVSVKKKKQAFSITARMRRKS